MRLLRCLVFFLAVPAAALAQAPAEPEVQADPPQSPEAPTELSDEAPEAETPDAEGTSAKVEQGRIVVIGRPIDVNRIAGSANTVTSEQLETMEYDDIQRVLGEVPGVYLRSEDGFGLRPNIGLRGASSDRSAKVTLMEDGVLLVPAPYSAPAAYYFPLTTRLVGVDVFKGPASIKYGPQTIGGAINLRTREIPTESEGGLDIAAGLQRSGKLHGYWGTSSENWGVLLEAAHLRTDGFKELDGGGDTGFFRNDIMLKGRWNTDLDSEVFHQIELKLGYGDEESQETYLGLTDDDFGASPLRRYRSSGRDQMDWWRTQAVLKYLVVPHETVELEVAAYRHDMGRVWNRLQGFDGGPDLYDVLANPDSPQNAVFLAVLRGEEDSSSPDQNLLIGANDRSFVSQGLQTVVNWRPEMPWAWFTQEIELGARFHMDSIHRDHWREPYAMQQQTLVRAAGDRRVVADNDGTSYAFASYLSDTIGLGDFLVTPGLRVEYIARDWDDRLGGDAFSDSDVVLIPGAGLSYRLHDFTFLGGVHKGFSPVSPGQPSAVNPEESINYEGGVRWAPEGAHAEVIGFFSDYRNITSECTLSTGCNEDQINRQFNGGNAWVYGVEVAGSWEGPLGGGVRLGVSANYTLTLSQFRSSFSSQNPIWGDVEEGDELPYVPAHQASTLLGLTWRDFAFNASFTYVGPMRDVAGQGSDGRSTDPQMMLDLSTSYAFFDDVMLYARAENVLDQDPIVSFRPAGARPLRPFLFQLGIKLGFDS